jgi:predicted DsbA family dithiol-disulfide isomerase
MDPVEPYEGTSGGIVLFSDVACPWSTVMVLRLRKARRELGVDVPVIHLAHPLELLYEHVLVRSIVDREVVICASAEPEFGWNPWLGRLDEYPVSSLLALEAVQAARRQSETAAEELDLALRRALFVGSRCITARHEVLAAAEECANLDSARLAEDLDSGIARAAVFRQSRAARDHAGMCVGYVVLPDGTGVCNPGIHTEWIGKPMPFGTPIVVSDDPGAYPDLIKQVV